MVPGWGVVEGRIGDIIPSCLQSEYLSTQLSPSVGKLHGGERGRWEYGVYRSGGKGSSRIQRAYTPLPPLPVTLATHHKVRQKGESSPRRANESL